MFITLAKDGVLISFGDICRSYTSHGHKLSFFEALKTEGEERIEGGFVRGMSLVEASGNSRLETGKVSVVMGIQTLFAHKLPQTFNQVEVGRIGRQKT